MTFCLPAQVWCLRHQQNNKSFCIYFQKQWINVFINGKSCLRSDWVWARLALRSCDPVKKNKNHKHGSFLLSRPVATQMGSCWLSPCMTVLFAFTALCLEPPQLLTGPRPRSAFKHCCWCFCSHSQLERCRGDGWVFPQYCLPQRTNHVSKGPSALCSALSYDSISASGWEQKTDSLIPPPQSNLPLAQTMFPSATTNAALFYCCSWGLAWGAVPAGLVLCHGRDSVV